MAKWKGDKKQIVNLIIKRVRVQGLGPGPRPVNYFLDSYSIAFRWVSKNKTQTLKKGAGPGRVQQGRRPMSIPRLECRTRSAYVNNEYYGLNRKDFGSSNFYPNLYK